MVCPTPLHRQQRRVCAASLAAAMLLYLASPYMALWSMGAALQGHDRAALRAALDWSAVRDGLKQSLGLDAGSIQPASQDTELPGFGESFATRVASGLIDDEVTPERLDHMLALPAFSVGHQPAGRPILPHGFFASLADFQATIPVPGDAPIRISMRIEKWRWKITRIILPDSMLRAPPAMHVASGA